MIQAYVHSSGKFAIPILPTVLVEAFSPRESTRKVQVRLLLDSGSQLSLVRSGVAKQLNLPELKRPVVLSTMGGSKVETTNAARIVVKSRFNDYEVEVTVTILPKLTEKFKPPPFHPFDHFPSLKKRLRGKPFAEDWPINDASIDLVIGQDFLFAILGNGKTVVPEEATHTGPYVIDSPFGLILQGLDTRKEHKRALHMQEELCAAVVRAGGLKVPKSEPIISNQTEPPLEVTLRQMFDLEKYRYSRADARENDSFGRICCEFHQ